MYYNRVTQNLVEKIVEGNMDDYKCKQKNRHTGILFGVV